MHVHDIVYTYNPSMPYVHSDPLPLSDVVIFHVIIKKLIMVNNCVGLLSEVIL
jgi:hypothetical protein